MSTGQLRVGISVTPHSCTERAKILQSPTKTRNRKAGTLLDWLHIERLSNTLTVVTCPAKHAEQASCDRLAANTTRKRLATVLLLASQHRCTADFAAGLQRQRNPARDARGESRQNAHRRASIHLDRVPTHCRNDDISRGLSSQVGGGGTPHLDAVTAVSIRCLPWQ